MSVCVCVCVCVFVCVWGGFGQASQVHGRERGQYLISVLEQYVAIGTDVHMKMISRVNSAGRLKAHAKLYRSPCTVHSIWVRLVGLI